MYEIGQQVVCVKTHSKRLVVEGNTCIVKNIKIDCCGGLVVDVGVKETNGAAIGSLVRCCYNRHTVVEDGVVWFMAFLFRPLDDLYNTEIEELMNEVNEKVPFEV